MKTKIKQQLLTGLYLVTFLFFGIESIYSQVASFFKSPVSSGLLEVRLYPMENVTPGTPVLVTFGVPFTRGSVIPSDINKIRVLTGSLTTSPEVPAYVKHQTPWRHALNPSLDSGSVRVAKIQIQHTFSTNYPNYETVYIQFGVSTRSANVSAYQNPKTAWHLVTSGSFVSADNVYEPDVYAVLPSQYLTNGALKTQQMLPLDATVPSTRENPTTVDAAIYPGYVKHDHGVHNFFFSIVNQDDPLVTTANQCPYKTDFEPWLYDRVTAMYNLYMRSGNIKVLREAVRNAEFYKGKLYDNTTTPSNAIGVFKLKVLSPSSYIGNNGAMYSFNEGLAYTYWLTGDDDMYEPIKWVVNAHEQNDPPTLWSPSAGSWTERFTSFRLLVNTVAFEVTGLSSYKNSLTNQSNDLIWHQNGAAGAIPANRIDGGLYHYGSQHGDGTTTSLLASSWMTVLIAEAMIRVYAVTESTPVASFVKRIGNFEKTALKLDANHAYNSDFSGPLWYGDYMMQYNGVSDVRDGSEIEHSMEISTTVAWAAYFSALLGNADSTLKNTAQRAYNSYNIGFNYWVRPAGPASGLTAYRVTPWRKYGWEYTPSGSFTWLMNTINSIPTGNLGKEKLIEKETLTVYPNPASTVVKVIYALPQGSQLGKESAHYKIVDVTGNIVCAGELKLQTVNEINVEGLAPGVYFITTTLNGHNQNHKIIKY